MRKLDTELRSYLRLEDRSMISCRGTANEGEITRFRQAGADLHISDEAANELLNSSASSEGFPAVGELEEVRGGPADFGEAEPSPRKTRISPAQRTGILRQIHRSGL